MIGGFVFISINQVKSLNQLYQGFESVFISCCTKGKSKEENINKIKSEKIENS